MLTWSRALLCCTELSQRFSFLHNALTAHGLPLPHNPARWTIGSNGYIRSTVSLFDGTRFLSSLRLSASIKASHAVVSQLLPCWLSPTMSMDARAQQAVAHRAQKKPSLQHATKICAGAPAKPLSEFSNASA